MRERPIPFSTSMVRAILDGTKTQTRRVVKPQPTLTVGSGFSWKGWLYGAGFDWPSTVRNFAHKCPYGQPGDRLWVKEPWKTNSLFNSDPPRDLSPGIKVFYLSDPSYSPDAARYRHARFMPRWASRITLEVTGVRVERLQAISEADAIAEGIHRIRIGDGYGDKYSASPRSWADAIEQHPDVQDTAGAAYRDLWDSINGERAWAANPWVWVVEFKQVAPESEDCPG